MKPITLNLSGWPPILILFGIALLGSVVHCAPMHQVGAWREVLPSLYYIPIVIAAINLGIRAAMSVAIASGVSHAIASAVGCGDVWVRPFTETILFICVGLTAAMATRMHESLAISRSRTSETERGESLEKAFRGTTSARQIPAFGQIVSGLVRRFRTPVSSIEGALWLIEDAHLTEEKHGEFVRIIRRESHQLERTLSDIQEFTQPRKPRIRKTDLSRLLDDVIQMAGPGEQHNFFLFRKDLPSTLPVLNCDPEQVSKMLLNLAINAMQSTPEGGELTWIARATDDHVVISLRDFGRGIPPEIVDRIFDPFFTTRENGMGLGLTVARQIAVAHGGTIAVDIADRGTSVTVVLPLNRPVPR